MIAPLRAPSLFHPPCRKNHPESGQTAAAGATFAPAPLSRSPSCGGARRPPSAGSPPTLSVRTGVVPHSAASDSPPASNLGKLSAFTGTYITAFGLALLVAPKTLFGLLFDATSVPPVWIRVGGVMSALFGSYYLGAAYGEATGRGLRGFYASTVLGRAFLSAVFCLLVVCDQAPKGLLLLAAANLVGAVSFARALGWMGGAK